MGEVCFYVIIEPTAITILHAKLESICRFLHFPISANGFFHLLTKVLVLLCETLNLTTLISGKGTIHDLIGINSIILQRLSHSINALLQLRFSHFGIEWIYIIHSGFEISHSLRTFKGIGIGKLLCTLYFLIVTLPKINDTLNGCKPHRYGIEYEFAKTCETTTKTTKGKGETPGCGNGTELSHRILTCGNGIAPQITLLGCKFFVEGEGSCFLQTIQAYSRSTKREQNAPVTGKLCQHNSKFLQAIAYAAFCHFTIHDLERVAEVLELSIKSLRHCFLRIIKHS